jgi:hypothetical protein
VILFTLSGSRLFDAKKVGTEQCQTQEKRGWPDGGKKASSFSEKKSEKKDVP